MGSDTNTNTASSSPNGKRNRDHEDEVYVDNLHSHKRYLSEMMASSLNGLTVGESMHEAIMDSPARSESMFYPRDELSLQYSPMSEDLDDVRYCETPMSACSSQSESRPTSPVSPYRYKPVGAFCYSPPGPSFPSNGCAVVSGPSQTRQRGSDTEGRLPSSPSDICHSSDLRKTALLRSVQMRTHVDGETRSYSYMKPLDDVREYHVDSCSYVGSSDSAFPATQLSMRNTEAKSQSCLYMKPMDDEREYHVEGCSSMVSSEPGFSRMLNNETDTPSCSYMKPLEDEVGYHVERRSPMGSSEPVFTETQEPMLSNEVEPLSFREPSDDGLN